MLVFSNNIYFIEPYNHKRHEFRDNEYRLKQNTHLTWSGLPHLWVRKQFCCIRVTEITHPGHASTPIEESTSQSQVKFIRQSAYIPLTF